MTTQEKSAAFLEQKYAEVIETLTPEQIEEFKDVFSRFDADESQTISCDELGPVMEALGHSPSKQELIEMIRLVDLDKSRTIDFKEFLALMALRMKQPFSSDEVVAAFAEFDEDGSGYIHVDTLRNMMTEILPHAMETTEVEEMISTAQPDEDGRIDYRAFVDKLFDV